MARPKPQQLPQCAPEFAHIHRKFEAKVGSFVARILPGEYYATGANEYIITTLGSCVSACLWDPVAGYGGMNHFLLPHGKDARADAMSVASYGSFAMEHLINAILKAGGRRGRLRAKIVGGGQVLDLATQIGAWNIAFVREYLAREGIEIAGEDVGGFCGRLVRFHPVTGRAAVKTLALSEHRRLAEKEDKYLDTVARQSGCGEIELF